MGLAGTVRQAARRFGRRTAVVDATTGWGLSYAGLDRCTDEAAAALAAWGPGPGDVVALTLPSSPAYLVAYLGAAKAGVTTAGINPRLAAPQRTALLQQAAPALVVGTQELLEGCPGPWQQAAIGLGSGPGDVLTGLRLAAAPPDVPDDPDRPLAIVFTSGTGGNPRGAVFTDRHVAAVTRLDAGERWGDQPLPMLSGTELAHIGAMTKLGWYLQLGVTLHVLRRWRAADALALISAERITSVGGIAAQIALMLREPDFDRYDLRAVSTIVAGGGPSPPALVREARERFGAAYSVRYSSTESGGVGTAITFDAPAARAAEGDEEALHTVGRPRPGVAVAVRDDAGRDLPVGEVGTVWLRSAAVMAGYWQDEAATAGTLVDGWLRTGDLGTLDERGRLRLAGRAGDVFIRGGYNVHPEPVEAVLLGHPLVADVAVVPRADPVLGEVGVAVVVPADPAAPPGLAQLREAGRAHLASHELPDDLLLVDSLPRNAVHKLDRRALLARLTPRRVEQ